MTAIPDASVLIAGADRKHELFESVEASLIVARERGRLIAQSIDECFLALTCMGIATPESALAYLEQFLARPPLGIAPADHPAAIREFTALGISGGAVHDGLIAIGARAARAPLLTIDRRAARTYDRCGVEYGLLA